MVGKPLPRTFGFTLVEMLVVLVIVGIITAIATLRLSGVTQTANLEWALDRIAATDDLLRTHSSNQGKCGRVRFELGTGRIDRFMDTKTDASETVALGHGITINRYLSASRDINAGPADVLYSPYGTSETFAVRLESASHRPEWMVFAGITGQLTRTADDRAVDRLVRPSGEKGADPR